MKQARNPTVALGLRSAYRLWFREPELQGDRAPTAPPVANADGVRDAFGGVGEFSGVGAREEGGADVLADDP